MKSKSFSEPKYKTALIGKNMAFETSHYMLLSQCSEQRHAHSVLVRQLWYYRNTEHLGGICDMANSEEFSKISKSTSPKHVACLRPFMVWQVCTEKMNEFPDELLWYLMHEFVEITCARTSTEKRWNRKVAQNPSTTRLWRERTWRSKALTMCCYLTALGKVKHILS